MPTVTVPKEEFLSRLGGSLTLDELDELCFSFGIEYEECSTEENGVETIKVEVAANRYDLLCLEGLVMALMAYRWNRRPEPITYANAVPRETAYVEVIPEVTPTRPYIVAACLRGVKMTQQIYDSLLDLQTKLHQNLCRKRTLAAIGVHDMDRIQEPLYYGLEKPEDIVFAPLTDSTREYTAKELMDHYSQGTSHLKAKGKDYFPVLRDKSGKVCSWPPIVNSAATQVTLESRDLFIEVTSTDRLKGMICLNIILHCFSQYCKEPYTVEPFNVKYTDKTVLCPNLEPRVVTGELGYLRTLVGLKDLMGDEVCDYLRRMMVEAKYDRKNGLIEAQIPIGRPDIQHACDLGEDIAIAYGFNKIQQIRFPMGRLMSITHVTRRMRDLMAYCGYKETKMSILDSLKNQYERMGWEIPKADSGRAPVLIRNSKVSEIEACRVSLLPGIIRTIANLKGASLPIQVYEVGEVVHCQEGTEVRAVNNTNMACGYANSTTAGLEEVQGVSELLLNDFGFYSEYQKWECGESNTALPDTWRHMYRLVETEDKAFMPNRAVKIVLSSAPDVVIGTMGIVHPDVLRRFHILIPVTVLELDVVKMKQVVG
ncbi:phenylalanine--tRNA ligase subunit beta [Babesia gibsoni]|uniref:phenylalanine--tRNA ligase n=1 Tax=Babesia gibsoni TaxID=33632 RepID=A0AAD8PGW7_BABGI|nr:phenylalanine--tRNA ligase subunit beta [Babesia gibsoni]